MLAAQQRRKNAEKRLPAQTRLTFSFSVNPLLRGIMDKRVYLNGSLHAASLLIRFQNRPPQWMKFRLNVRKALKNSPTHDGPNGRLSSAFWSLLAERNLQRMDRPNDALYPQGAKAGVRGTGRINHKHTAMTLKRARSTDEPHVPSWMHLHRKLSLSMESKQVPLADPNFAKSPLELAMMGGGTFLDMRCGVEFGEQKRLRDHEALWTIMENLYL
ncbi:hypothetical protein PROFUN_01743 [Planoprotostelium fungivorum]|uniref:Uncharacterized protein n=1 Tax=Planoprotostelium fungivorum TaxID=1890364 RepID=A0A2P6MWF5_9EUKA|nr:hypothetical protein PROFUN_01743 [Planoprotostelium fungivorum]